jgi:hypothetical protein
MKHYGSLFADRSPIGRSLPRRSTTRDGAIRMFAALERVDAVRLHARGGRLHGSAGACRDEIHPLERLRLWSRTHAPVVRIGFDPQAPLPRQFARLGGFRDEAAIRGSAPRPDRRAGVRLDHRCSTYIGIYAAVSARTTQ